MKRTLIAIGTFLLIASTVSAQLTYNENIVAIFGSGNPDTGWTAQKNGSLTLALRAKNRETASTANVSGFYSMPLGFQAPQNNRARWNWEFSINSGDVVLAAYDYYLEIDLDHSTGISNLVVNALTFFADNSYGDSTTANGQGVEGAAAVYASQYSIAQQSQNIVFYGGDPNLDATYTYALYAVPAGAGPNGTRLATVGITVIVGAGGPLPPDDDNDLVPNTVDLCPNTPAGDAVDVQGCSIQDLVNKCAVSNASDHGEYVACVVELAIRLFGEGKITQTERRFMITTAAQSDVGKTPAE